MKRTISDTAWPLDELEFWGIVTDFRLFRLTFFINRKLNVNLTRYHWNLPGHDPKKKPVTIQPEVPVRKARWKPKEKKATEEKLQPGYAYFLEVLNPEANSFLYIISNRQEVPLPEDDHHIAHLNYQQPKTVFLEPKFQKLNAFIVRTRNALPEWESIATPLRKVNGIRSLVSMNKALETKQLEKLPYFDPT